MPYYARRHQLSGNLLYHIYNRANARYDIFKHDDDFIRFIDILKKYAYTFDLSIYHWVIMSNHYHLLIEIANPERLSAAMAGIHKSYTYYYHKRHDTCGFLWQGRFKSQPIQKDRYLLACGRYIERNPVLAHIVAQAELYPYSSARFHITGIDDSITKTDPLYETFGATPDERRSAYSKFLSSFDEQEDLWFDNIENPVGDALFKNKLYINKGRLLPRRKGRIKSSVFES